MGLRDLNSYQIRIAPNPDNMKLVLAYALGRLSTTRRTRVGITAHRVAVSVLRDPTVKCFVGGRELRLPLSHDLPVILATHPAYSDNLTRLVCATSGTIVDIGANVGDTWAFIRKVSDTPILCVEGDSRFLPYLRHNIAGDTATEIAAVYVGGRDQVIKLDRRGTGGTAHLVAGSNDTRLVALSSLLAAHPRFSTPGLIKIDTDGYEAEVLLGALDVLEKTRPVLFIEYDPILIEPVSGDARHLLDGLRQIGYEYAIAWDNYGAFLFSVDRAQFDVLYELHQYLSRPERPIFIDLALFHDRAAFELVRSCERGPDFGGSFA